MTHTDYTKKILNIEDENIYFYEKFEWNSKWTTIFNTGVFSLSLATLDILVKNHIIGIAVLPIYMEGDF